MFRRHIGILVIIAISLTACGGRVMLSEVTPEYLPGVEPPPEAEDAGGESGDESGGEAGDELGDLVPAGESDSVSAYQQRRGLLTTLGDMIASLPSIGGRTTGGVADQSAASNGGSSGSGPTPTRDPDSPTDTPPLVTLTSLATYAYPSPTSGNSLAAATATPKGAATATQGSSSNPTATTRSQSQSVPSNTPKPPTNTPVPPTNTPRPTNTPTDPPPPPTETPTDPPPQDPPPEDPPPSGSCPSSGGGPYDLIPFVGPAADHPDYAHGDLNLSLRGWSGSDGDLSLVDYSGGTDGNAPQLAGVLNRVPSFVSGYRVNHWNWGCGGDGCRGDPIYDWDITLLGMGTSPGEAVRPPSRGPTVAYWGAIAMVLYADDHRITLTYTSEDTVANGYAVHIENICVDPDLLGLYRAQVDGGGWHVTGHLPGVRNGQRIGVADGNGILVAIRDRGTFLDPRSRKDWWQ